MTGFPDTIVCFSHLPWSTMWKRTQTLIASFSGKDRIARTVFVNPDLRISSLVFNFREQLSASNHKLYRFGWKAAIPRRVTEKILAVTPVYFIPFSRSSRTLSRLQRAFHDWLIGRFVRGRKFILVINDFPFNPDRRALIESLRKRAALVIFDWSDDFSEFFQDPSEKKAVNDYCDECMRKAHLVFTVNQNLTRRALALNPRSYTVMNGADYGHFSDHSSEQDGSPAEFRAISGPVLGYIGWMAPARIDSELIRHLASMHPDWNIVMIGPATEKFAASFGALRNVVFLPPVDYMELPRYLRRFDVCIIPHIVNDHTRGNNPLKMYQYLAAGKPVVTTAISGMELFGKVAYIADSREQFEEMVSRALKEDGAELRDRRMEKARENSWSTRTEEAWQLIEKTHSEPESR